MKNKVKKKKIKVEDQKKIKAYILRAVIAVCLGIFIGLVFEGIYELNTYRKTLKGENSAELEKIREDDIKIINRRSEEGELVKSVRIVLPERYVHKLRYEYSSDETFTPEVKIYTKDIYKNPEVREIKEINRFNLEESIVNIQDYITEIEITVPKEAELGGFTIDNRVDFNWYRVLYVGIFAFLIFVVCFFRSVFAEKIEYGFAVIALSCGILFLAIQPPECGSWDEHIHFGKTFDWFEDGIADRSISEAYIYHNPESLERSAFLSKEEKSLQIEYLNQNAGTVAETYERNAFTLNAVGEVHMALAVKLVKHLGMSFYAQFLAGKFANLCLYVFLMFWAIRIVPVGKKFLTVISLMPTIMLQSVSFTYDIVVIGFTALGFVLIIDEFFEIHRKFTLKQLLLISLVFIIGSCPKPIYIVLLALLLALPKSKFKSVGSMAACKGIILIVCVIMIMTLLMPAAGGAVEGDPRGGETNVTEQLNLVFAHPIGYFRVFLENFMGTADEYFFGSESLGHLAYAGMHPYKSLIGVFCIGVALTEKKRRFPLDRKNMIFYKGFLALVIAAVIGLTWSALYIAFTPVGQTSIQGVQARYYFPLLFPLLMLFYPNKAEGKWKEKSYTMVILLIVLWITHQAMYQTYFLPYCQ